MKLNSDAPDLAEKHSRRVMEKVDIHI